MPPSPMGTPRTPCRRDPAGPASLIEPTMWRCNSCSPAEELIPLSALGVDHPERMTTDVADREVVRRKLPPSSGEPARAHAWMWVGRHGHVR